MNSNSQEKEECERDNLARERTLFAAERTVSAWIRTGLASVGGGFAIIRFLIFQDWQHRMIAYLIGEILILWGICIMLFAWREYQGRCKKMESPLNKLGWVTVTVSIFVLISLLLFAITL